jgi:hypothetical protein
LIDDLMIEWIIEHIEIIDHRDHRCIGSWANHSMRPHSAQMRNVAVGSAQSTLKALRVRVLRSALPGANLRSPQYSYAHPGRPVRGRMEWRVIE